MWTLIRNIPLVMTWLPVVMAGVTIIESLFGSEKSGPEKKEAVLAWLARAGEKLGLPWTERALEVVSGLIDVVVDVLNFIGSFRHAEETPPEDRAAQQEIVRTTATSLKRSVEDMIDEDPVLAEFLQKTR